MAQRAHLIMVVLSLLVFSCEKFYKDDFQLNIPTENRIKINFPGLVEFEIIQTVIPDNRGILKEVSNTFVVSNELDQPINQLKFGINIFDPVMQFESNLKVAYVDSIRQALTPFGQTEVKVFNNSFDSPLSLAMIDIFIVNQDVLDTHPFSGIYTGEGFFYASGDTVATSIPFIKGAIDYKGEVGLRTSESNGVAYTITGRVSTSGQFIGKVTSSSANNPSGNFKNEAGTEILLQDDRLTISLAAEVTNTFSIDSIFLLLNRN